VVDQRVAPEEYLGCVRAVVVVVAVVQINERADWRVARSHLATEAIDKVTLQRIADSVEIRTGSDAGPTPGAEQSDIVHELATGKSRSPVNPDANVIARESDVRCRPPEFGKGRVIHWPEHVPFVRVACAVAVRPDDHVVARAVFDGFDALPVQ